MAPKFHRDRTLITRSTSTRPLRALKLCLWVYSTNSENPFCAESFFGVLPDLVRWVPCVSMSDRRGVCAPAALVPCVGSRRRVPLPDSGDIDASEKAARNTALGLSPDSSPSKSGVLNKQGEVLFKGWAERFVVLDHIALRYYDVSYKDAETLPSSAARGLIPLTSRSKVLKQDGPLAPRSRGAGLDWKGSITEGKGMPFCFKIETAGKDYFFQAWNESERSAWISVLHSRVEYLSQLDPRFQHQKDLADDKKKNKLSRSGAMSPLSGRSTPALSEEEDEILDIYMMTDGLSQQLRLALKVRILK